jgi:hypothetical protein
MRKWFLIGLTVVFLPFSANAGFIGQTFGEVNFDGVPMFPETEQAIGTFNFDLTGLTIVSAALEGTFGNSSATSTAPVDVFADEWLVAQCLSDDPCFQVDIDPWSFLYADFSDLLDGSLGLSFIQTDESMTRLGETTLTIETAAIPEPSITAPSAVPVPAAVWLFGTALIGLIGMSRRRKVA